MEAPACRDQYWMQRCLDLALRARGCTSPNPLVGAVVVRSGECVGQGYHQAAGGPHAEVHALAEAGALAAGAVLYVNLEPCSHYGRTPPCVEQIKQANVGRVVVAMPDPNPQVAGQGIASLRQAGIAVQVGLMAEEAFRLNEAFCKFVTHHKPYVILKTAASLDGRAALSSGLSQWITGEQARQDGHRLRAECDAILVGSGTVLTDNPSLTARPLPNGCTQPLRVILDGRGRTAPTARVFHQPGHTLWVVGPDAALTSGPAHEQVTRLRSPTYPISLPWLLGELAKRQVTSLVVEGGPTVAAAFLREHEVDQVVWYLAPRLIGAEGQSAVGDLGIAALTQTPQLHQLEVQRCGCDVRLSGYLRAPDQRGFPHTLLAAEKEG